MTLLIKSVMTQKCHIQILSLPSNTSAQLAPFTHETPPIGQVKSININIYNTLEVGMNMRRYQVLKAAVLTPDIAPICAKVSLLLKQHKDVSDIGTNCRFFT